MITYLYHSGFALAWRDTFLVFDYYRDTCDGKRLLKNGVVTPKDFEGYKHVIVFVSHNHGDHFNPVIFKWRAARPDIIYVLSDDVRSREQALRIGPYESSQIPGGEVRTYGSTDEGISFMVEVQGLRVFHAGDLNLWHWKAESTEKEVRVAKAEFLTVMDHLEDEKAIDIAFFPVDPRMGKAHDAGAAYFMGKMKPSVFCPMHYGEDTDAARRFAARTDLPPECRVVAFTERGQQESCAFAAEYE